MLLLYCVRQSHPICTEDRRVLVNNDSFDVESIGDGLLILV
jgi:hypothetical protein